MRIALKWLPAAELFELPLPSLPYRPCKTVLKYTSLFLFALLQVQVESRNSLTQKLDIRLMTWQLTYYHDGEYKLQTIS